ncbi:hypothetical protein [Nostoc sp.]|uniref:hypothetical protein n=1 Tax=Nostoc sp. TaxID=1180 RepID=UPI002FFAC830
MERSSVPNATLTKQLRTAIVKAESVQVQTISGLPHSHAEHGNTFMWLLTRSIICLNK